MDRCPTVKVKPWSKDQGDFVAINESDFDPSLHELYEPAAEVPPAKRKRGQQ